MEDQRNLSTKEKALKINLDSTIYGSFSEIGAGQEVSGNFFQAGGSSGTIALSHSAYDMKISDSIYGESPRYVSEQRLMAMMEHDYNNITQTLAHRKDDTKFFAFADTIEALNYHKTNQGQGWIGLKFQTRPNGPVNTVVLHVLLHDNDNLLQQKAIGRLGVNLVYACFYHTHDINLFLASLLDSLGSERVEVDMLNISGSDFKHIDNRLLSLKMVKLGLSQIAMFDSTGRNVQAADKLYKKNILVLRGRFRPPTLVNVDMILSAYRQFRQDSDVERKKMEVLCELTLSNLHHEGAEIDEVDFLERVDVLASLGQTVMITNFQYYYELVTYLSNVNRGRKLGVILGINNLEALFDKTYYKHLKGGILESFGRLFERNVKLMVYPSTTSHGDQLYTTENFEVNKRLYHLFQYLIDTGKIVDIKDVNSSLLTIFSDDVLEMIKNQDERWCDLVPNKVSKAIKRLGLFHYNEIKKIEEKV